MIFVVTKKLVNEILIYIMKIMDYFNILIKFKGLKMSSGLLNVGRAFALSAASALSGCVMVIPIPPSASPRFQGCAEQALDLYAGAGTPTVSNNNEVRQNGWVLTQHRNGSVQIYAPNAQATNIQQALTFVMDCK